MGFKVIDKRTGKEADPYEIALHEEWANGLVYCDMEGFAITEDGSLVLMDECGHSVYCDTERFKVVYEDKRQHGEWEIHSAHGRIYHLFCSECKKDAEDYISGSENWWINSVPNFCPNCGADMRGGDEK